MVMGGELHSRGLGFESEHWTTIFHIILLKNCNVCKKRPKINKKRPRRSYLKKMVTDFAFILALPVAKT